MPGSFSNAFSSAFDIGSSSTALLFRRRRSGTVIITPGTTDVTIEILVVDDASLPVTGLVAATLPDIYYSRSGEALPSALTLSDLAAQDSAHSDGGVKELAVGRYRLDLPDAAFATATLLYVFGEETGKRVICEQIVVATIGTSTFDHTSHEVTVGTNNDKTGYKLASDGLDAITVTVSGVASTFPQMLVQVWRRFFKKADRDATTIQTYADDETTVLTEQTISDSGGVETQGAASEP